MKCTLTKIEESAVDRQKKARGLWGSEVASPRDVCGEVEKKDQGRILLGGGFI